jgi:hypothetical protein
MSVVRKFVIYGPVDTIKRLNQTVIDGTSPTHHFASDRISGNGHYVDVCIYEEHQKLMNARTSVTLIMEFTGKSAVVEAISTGGRMGFRGSIPSGDQSIFESVTDFVIDFSKRFGLTMQEITAKTVEVVP